MTSSNRPSHPAVDQFLASLQGFNDPTQTVLHISFNEPQPGLNPTPMVLSAFLMLLAWVEVQGWSAMIFGELRNRAKIMPTPSLHPKIFNFDWYSLTDEIDWDFYLDGGIAVGSSSVNIAKLRDADTLIINGKSEIYIVGNPERCSQLLATLKDWAERVAPFFKTDPMEDSRPD